jgi:hypothetical protein
MAQPLTSASDAFRAVTNLIRPNRFSVDISIGDLQITSERVESVEFPAYGIETIDFRFNNQPLFKIPYATQFQNTCNITFRLDGDGKIINSLYRELNKAFVISDELYMAYAEELFGELTVKCHRVDNSAQIIALTLSNAYLINIEAAQLSYDENDSYLKQTAVFSYQYAQIQ